MGKTLSRQRFQTRSQENGPKCYGVMLATKNLQTLNKIYFENIYKNKHKKRQIEISKLLLKNSYIRFNYERQKCSQISQIAKQYFQQNFVQEVSTLISSQLDKLHVNKTDQDKEGFLILLGQIGSILRLDYKIFYRKFTEHFTSQTGVDNIFSICYAISSVKTQNLTPNELITNIQMHMNSTKTDAEAKKKMIQKITSIIQELNQVEPKTFMISQ